MQSSYNAKDLIAVLKSDGDIQDLLFWARGSGDVPVNVVVSKDGAVIGRASVFDIVKHYVNSGKPHELTGIDLVVVLDAEKQYRNGCVACGPIEDGIDCTDHAVRAVRQSESDDEDDAVPVDHIPSVKDLVEKLKALPNQDAKVFVEQEDSDLAYRVGDPYMTTDGDAVLSVGAIFIDLVDDESDEDDDDEDPFAE